MKLSEFKNPLVASKGNIFSIEDWAGGILWVIFAGAVFTAGSKIMSKVDDAIIPGNVTPNAYRNAQVMPAAKTDTVKVY